MIKRIAIYFLLFLFFCVTQVYICAASSFSLGTFRLFTDAGVLFEAVIGSITAFAGILLCVFILMWIDWILSRTIYAYISFRLKRNHKLGILGIYRLLIVLVIILVSFHLYNRIPSDFFRQKDVSDMRDHLIKERFIIHAGGFIDGDDYTNSKEAIENCYDQGDRICEVDIMMTSDGALVLAHDSDDGYWARGTNIEEIPTLDEFLAQKIDGKYTAMSMDDLADFMRKHPDFMIVTDIKDEKEECITKISNDYPDLLKRIIVQIYHETEYDTVSELGFPYIIYTLYEAEEDELSLDALARAAIDDVLVGFTFWADWTIKDDFMEGMRKTETPLLVHTLNTREDIHYALLDGISGIYTDLTDVEAYREL